MPIWLQSNQLVITKSLNGFVVSPERNTPAHECVAFATWQELVDWLESNWAEPQD